MFGRKQVLGWNIVLEMLYSAIAQLNGKTLLVGDG
jgi:hypothetical protein